MPNEPKFSSVPAEVQDDALSVYPGSIPSTPIIWPTVQHNANQIQQTKGSAKPQATGVQPTTLPNQSTVAPRTTPAHVSNVRVVSRNVGGQKNLTVQFNHPSGDPYFSGAKVYLRQGNQEPVLVASGSKSPLTFTATNNSAPHSIFVTSVGNWGETDVMTSPGAPVKLLGPLNVSKVPGIALAAGGGGSPAPPPGVTDGLIHGQGGGGVDTGSWESDPAYVLMRDDFLSAIASGGAITTSSSKIGDLGWILATTNGGALSMSLGAPPNLGTFSFGNVGTQSEVLPLILSTGSAENTGSFYNDNTMALLEYPSWKATFVWKTDFSIQGTRQHTTTKQAIYIGFVAGDYAGSLASNISSRPNTFMGLRFDTSTSPGNLVVTTVANASSGTTAYTVTSNTFGANSGLAGTTFVTTNCGSAANNGTFLCTASTATSVTLLNASGVSATGLTGQAAGPASPPNDTFYTFEVVDNLTNPSSTYGRNNQQGLTFVTNVAPVAGVWHRLDIVCTSVGVVTMTLDGSATNTHTFTVPVQTLTVINTAAEASNSNGSTQISLSGGAANGAFATKWTQGSLVTTAGFTSVYNGTFPLNRSTGASTILFNNPLGSGISQPATATLSGYPAWIPTFWFGNDDTASPSANTIWYYVDFFSFIWNPAVGGGSGTPALTNSRYFPSVVG